MMYSNWKEVAEAWSEGQSVWSAELGGIGPGYEQAIQILLMEIMVAWPKNVPVPAPEEEKYPKAYLDHVNEVVSALDGNYGFSGAQVGVAKATAYQFMHYGYAEMMSKLEEDRKILVSKNFPCAEATK